MILIGTSGWSYRHWSGGAFYPKGLASGQWLEYYARRYATVEINASFYRLPGETMVARWREVAPPGFVFSAKGSRLITHAHRLKGAAESVQTFMRRLGRLGEALAVVLWQLPPSMERTDENLTRLDAFLGLLRVTCATPSSSATRPGSVTRPFRCCVTTAWPRWP